VAQRRPSILVVDADSDFRQSVVQCLEDSECVGAQSATFADAIDRVNGFAYDGLIVDVELPGGDGLEVLSTARSRYPEMACIVVADLGNINQAVKALKLGAVDYLIKPLDAAQVASG
jgi:DNA-binding NtrC family response regulator